MPAVRLNPHSRHGLIAGCFAVVLCLVGTAGFSLRPSFAASAAADSAEMAVGKAVYDQRCAICHFSDSTAKKVGPGLKDMYPRGKFADGKKVDDASVTAWIEKGGKDMPGYKDVVKPDQVRALVAYLKSL